MKFEKTFIEGLTIIYPKVFHDERGSFYESWKDKDFQQLGSTPFVQDNMSFSKKNVLRGMHSQKNQSQLVTVVSGKILDVVIDIRKDSPTYKKYFAIELSDHEPKQLFMKPGLAHGFCTLSEEVIINYKCTQYYSPQDEERLAWNDAEANIEWPQGINFIIGEKDRDER